MEIINCYTFSFLIKKIKMKGPCHVTGGYINLGCLRKKFTKKCIKSEFKSYKKVAVPSSLAHTQLLLIS